MLDLVNIVVYENYTYNKIKILDTVMVVNRLEIITKPEKIFNKIMESVKYKFDPGDTFTMYVSEMNYEKQPWNHVYDGVPHDFIMTSNNHFRDLDTKIPIYNIKEIKK